MLINLLVSLSPDIKVDKITRSRISLSGTFREGADISFPVFDVELVGGNDFNLLMMSNYCEIPDLFRKYFIRKRKIVNNKLITLELECDVLSSFDALLKYQVAHIVRSETEYNDYFDDNIKATTKVDIQQYTHDAPGTYTRDNVTLNIHRIFNFAPTGYYCIINTMANPNTKQTDFVPGTGSLPLIDAVFSSDSLSSMVQCLSYDDLDYVLFQLYGVTTSLITFVKKIMILPFQPELGVSLNKQCTVAGTQFPTTDKVYLAKYGSRERFRYASFTITPKYNDFRDYSPYTTYSIYLPFVGWVKLSPYDVLNSTCDIYYAIDYESGNCMCYIYKVNNGNRVIYTSQCQIGVSVGLSQSNIEQNNIASQQHAIQYGIKTLTTLIASGAFSVATGNPIPIAVGLGSSFLGGIGEIAHQSDAYIDTVNVQAGTGNLISQLPLDLKIKITYQELERDPNDSDYLHMFGRPCDKFIRLSTTSGYTAAIIDEFEIPTTMQSDPQPTKEEVDILLDKVKKGIIL